VSELQNRIKRALVLAEGPYISPFELELEDPNGSSEFVPSTIKETKERAERQIVLDTLRENNGNISKTAKALGISRPTLYDLIAKYSK
jgi:two-component system NtrC family response regulator